MNTKGEVCGKRAVVILHAVKRHAAGHCEPRPCQATPSAACVPDIEPHDHARTGESGALCRQCGRHRNAPAMPLHAATGRAPSHAAVSAMRTRSPGQPTVCQSASPEYPYLTQQVLPPPHPAEPPCGSSPCDAGGESATDGKACSSDKDAACAVAPHPGGCRSAATDPCAAVLQRHPAPHLPHQPASYSGAGRRRSKLCDDAGSQGRGHLS